MLKQCKTDAVGSYLFTRTGIESGAKGGFISSGVYGQIDWVLGKTLVDKVSSNSFSKPRDDPFKDNTGNPNFFKDTSPLNCSFFDTAKKVAINFENLDANKNPLLPAVFVTSSKNIKPQIEKGKEVELESLNLAISNKIISLIAILSPFIPDREFTDRKQIDSGVPSKVRMFLESEYNLNKTQKGLNLFDSIQKGRVLRLVWMCNEENLAFEIRDSAFRALFNKITACFKEKYDFIIFFPVDYRGERSVFEFITSNYLQSYIPDVEDYSFQGPTPFQVAISNIRNRSEESIPKNIKSEFVEGLEEFQDYNPLGFVIPLQTRAAFDFGKKTDSMKSFEIPESPNLIATVPVVAASSKQEKSPQEELAEARELQKLAEARRLQEIEDVKEREKQRLEKLRIENEKEEALRREKEEKARIAREKLELEKKLKEEQEMKLKQERERIENEKRILEAEAKKREEEQRILQEKERQLQQEQQRIEQERQKKQLEEQLEKQKAEQAKREAKLAEKSIERVEMFESTATEPLSESQMIEIESVQKRLENELQQEKEIRLREISRIEQEKQGLSNQLKTITETLQSERNQKAEQFKELTDNKAQNDILKQQILDLNKKLFEEKENSQRIAFARDEAQLAIVKQRDIFFPENERLKKEIENLRLVPRVIAPSAAQLTNAERNELDQLKLERANFQLMTDQYNQTRLEAENLKNQIEQLRSTGGFERSDLKREFDKLNNDLRIANQENNSLKVEKETLQKEVKDLETSFKDLQSKLRAKTNTQESDDKIKLLENTIINLTSELNKLKDELRMTNSALDETRLKYKSLLSQKGIDTEKIVPFELKQENEIFKNQIELFKQRIIKLQSELTEAKKKITDMENEQSERLSQSINQPNIQREINNMLKEKETEISYLKQVISSQDKMIENLQFEKKRSIDRALEKLSKKKREKEVQFFVPPKKKKSQSKKETAFDRAVASCGLQEKYF